jgi:heat shock protein HtpX
LEVANNATAHLYIANPFKGKIMGSWFSHLFDTHPPIEERIKILRAM